MQLHINFELIQLHIEQHKFLAKYQVYEMIMNIY